MLKVTLTILLAAVTAPASAFLLNILHTNDMHSRFFEVNSALTMCRKKNCYGGFARIAQLVRELKGPTSVFLNAGDNFLGSMYFTRYGWRVVNDLLSDLPIDAMSLGNHEFDLGNVELANYLMASQTPIVTCNVDFSKDPAFNRTHIEKVKKWMILNVNGTKIGVVGYLTPDTKYLSLTGNVTISDEIECIVKAIPEMREAGAEYIVALGHSGIEKDEEIARMVEGVDVVVGGHTDTFLYTGAPPDLEVPEGPYPIIVRQHSGKQVPVVQAFGYTKYLGNLKVEWDKNGKLVKAYGNPILLNSSFQEDSHILDKLYEYKARANITNEIVANSVVDLNGFCRRSECNLGNIIIDAFVDYLKPQIDRHRPVIGFLNSGSVRSSVLLKDSDGVVMEDDVLTISPFDVSLVHAVSSGEDIVKLLMESLSKRGTGGFLQVSGMKVNYVNIGSGKQKAEVFVSEKKEFVPIELNKVYDVVIPDYIYYGGDGYKIKGRLNFIHEYEFNHTEAISKYMAMRSPLKMEAEGRINFITSDPSSSGPIKPNYLLNSIVPVLFAYGFNKF